MKNWNIEISSDFNQQELSKKFQREFPNRSEHFFLDLLEAIDYESTKVCLLYVDQKIEGSMILFKVVGCDKEIYAPSYFFVSSKHRNLSLTFLMQGQQMVSNYILNITPNKKMFKILQALKYEKHSYGSSFKIGFFNLFSFRKNKTKSVNHSSLSKVPRAYFLRADLNWFQILHQKEKYYFCFKSTSWFGIPLKILVYFSGGEKNKIASLLPKINHRFYFSLLIFPDFLDNFYTPKIIKNKFRIFGNFEGNSELFSILGSEVTEIL